ncbi:hypothetical protein [Legionella tunisiensis]|uniref:hypothetical protein n=1 Tax=Legionella tunisiensis TaxID=1034944 RepID=UPI0002DE4915|nr:hypothetical protein [Legionella tunisiensis]
MTIRIGFLAGGIFLLSAGLWAAESAEEVLTMQKKVTSATTQQAMSPQGGFAAFERR